LADIAKELGLDIEAEHDLAAVAQYSLNRTARKRNRLTHLIVDHFPPRPDAPEPLRILARRRFDMCGQRTTTSCQKQLGNKRASFWT
jgi:hypothetical protein